MLTMRYATLALTPVGSRALPTTQPANDPATVAQLFGPERKKYDAIAIRDLFRPFIARPAPPPPPPQQPVVQPSNPPPPPPPPPPEDTFMRLAGLPRWNDQAEALVVDNRNQQATSYKAGDTVAGVQVVRIDYRPLPAVAPPGQPADPNLVIMTYGRVIVKKDGRYWFWDLGETLNQRHEMPVDQLPDDLRAEATAQNRPPQG